MTSDIKGEGQSIMDPVAGNGSGKSLSELHDYLRQLPDAAIVLREDGMIVAVNERSTEALSISTDNLLQSNVDDLFEISGSDERANRVSFFIERTVLPLSNVPENVFVTSGNKAEPIDVRTIALPQGTHERLFLSIVTALKDSGSRVAAKRYDEFQDDGSDEGKNSRQRFMAMLGHELRTPLTVVRSSTDLLRRYSHQLTEDQRDRYLALIQEQVHVLSRLVNDVMAINEEGQTLQVELRSVEAASFIETLLEQCADLPRNHGAISTVNEWPKGTIIIDAHLLRLALGNIIADVVRRSSADSGITLRFFPHENSLMIVIHAEGCEVPVRMTSDVSHAFNKDSIDDNAYDSGLGLTIARDIILAHKGDVSATGMDDKGSVVRIRIPQG